MLDSKSFRSLAIGHDTFGYQLAYVRDVIAGLTQAELAEAINEVVLGRINITRIHIKNWENNTDLEQVSPGVVAAITEVFSSRLNYQEHEKNELAGRLKDALAKSRQEATVPGEHKSPGTSFGDLLSKLREEQLAATQSELAGLLVPLVAAHSGPASRISFDDVFAVERGLVPRREFVEAAIEVFLARGVPTDTLQVLRAQGEAALKQPSYPRPLAAHSTETLLTRAGHILLCEGTQSAEFKPRKRPHFLAPNIPMKRSFRDIENGSGAPAALMLALFSDRRLDTVRADHRDALRDYLLREGVPAEEIQEFDAILQEINIRKVGFAAGRSPPQRRSR